MFLFMKVSFSAQMLRIVMPLKNGIHLNIIEKRKDGFLLSQE